MNSEQNEGLPESGNPPPSPLRRTAAISQSPNRSERPQQQTFRSRRGFEPLSDAETKNVQHDQQEQQNQRSRQREGFAVRERFVPGSENKHEHADEIKHDRRHVHHVVRPVAPTGEKTVEVPEYFLGPEVDAALARITMREFNHGDALRPEEQYERDNPQPHRYATIGADGRNDVEVENSDNKNH